MRNLQNVFFLSLLGLLMGTGCTITTTDEPLDGEGGTGNDTTSTAGNGGSTTTTVASGGTSATSATSTGTAGTTSVASGGTSATTTSAVPAFTAANCPAAAAAAPPAFAADVPTACVACMYDATKACTQAVACHNESDCMTEVWAALECIEFRFRYATVPIPPSELRHCQNGEFLGTGLPAGSEQIAPPLTATGNYWQGSAVSLVGGDLLTTITTSCATECDATVGEELP